MLKGIRNPQELAGLNLSHRLIARIEKEEELNLLDIAAAASYLIQRERPLDVKEPPREARREPYRDNGRDGGREGGRDGRYERPRRQDGARDEEDGPRAPRTIAQPGPRPSHEAYPGAGDERQEEARIIEHPEGVGREIERAEDGRR